MSSLKKRREEEEEDAKLALSSASSTKTILRKLSYDVEQYNVVSNFCSKSEACVFYPRLPRSWLGNGLIVVPCLSEKGVKSHFELEVYCSENVNVHQLPETYARSITGEWVEGNAGGCHLNSSTWKKNPKFTLRLHNPVTTDAPARIRITLAKYGANWRSSAKRDAVGTMIGFYIFVTSSTESTQFYESTFLPDEEVSTDPSFTLPQLSLGQTYTIMPATFNEGKLGAFVISIISEYEFQISKDK